MSDFKFNFALDGSYDFEEISKMDDLDPFSCRSRSQRSKNSGVPMQVPETSFVETLRAAKEVSADSIALSSKDHDTCALVCGDTLLHYSNPAEIEGKLQNASENESSDTRKAIKSHSDLVPCVYEGGLKVWECSVDLVHYLHEENVLLTDLSVLELGCGAGLPGIYAMKKGARVHFQDYNEEVLALMTIPNVLLNLAGKPSVDKCRFWAGDWSLVQQILDKEQQRFDIILTAETIYSTESQPKLYDIIRTLLKPDGRVILAAKTHYFGVGGGTRQFEEFVCGRGEFEIKPCKVLTEGVQREILEMTSSDRRKCDAKT